MQNDICLGYCFATFSAAEASRRGACKYIRSMLLVTAHAHDHPSRATSTLCAHSKVSDGSAGPDFRLGRAQVARRRRGTDEAHRSQSQSGSENGARILRVMSRRLRRKENGAKTFESYANTEPRNAVA